MRVAVETAIMAKIRDLDDALTWSINLSSNLARLSYLVIVSGCKFLYQLDSPKW